MTNAHHKIKDREYKGMGHNSPFVSYFHIASCFLITISFLLLHIHSGFVFPIDRSLFLIEVEKTCFTSVSLRDLIYLFNPILCTHSSEPIMHRMNGAVPPPPFSLLSRLTLSAAGCNEFSVTAEKLKTMVDERTEGIQRGNGVTFGVFDECPPLVDLSFYPHPTLPQPIDLHPQVAVFEVDSSYSFASGRMEEFCRRHPISIVRGLPDALGIDMTLYSIDALSSLHPRMPIKLYSQKKQEPDMNVDDRGRPTWESINVGSQSILKTQVCYMKEMQKKESVIGGKRSKKDETVRFGVANLSEFPQVFDKQIQELQKFPSIFRPSQPTDLHSLMGFELDGLTGAYAYLKVAGVRTTAHEEDGGVPSINIAVGPGTSEWICCDLRYVKEVQELAVKKGLEYPGSSIWPDYKELERSGVPVIRFVQKPGDLVFTGAGTLHWVQGPSMGLNIAWNSGSLSTSIIKHCRWQIERNRAQGLHSEIPLERTVWRIATMGRKWDRKLFFELRGILVRSLSHLLMVEKWLLDSGVVAVAMSAAEIEDRFTCDECQCEVYNMVFVAAGDVDRCFACMMQNGGTQVHTPRRQRSMDVLCGIFDSFTM